MFCDPHPNLWLINSKINQKKTFYFHKVPDLFFDANELYHILLYLTSSFLTNQRLGFIFSFNSRFFNSDIVNIILTVNFFSKTEFRSVKFVLSHKIL